VAAALPQTPSGGSYCPTPLLFLFEGRGWRKEGKGRGGRARGEEGDYHPHWRYDNLFTDVCSGYAGLTLCTTRNKMFGLLKR